ncbi:response regulator [Haloferax larsenii]|uniref:Response regulator n=1 Tax=Haloferax larsenii TaxID=302484 RepID=A0ABY5RCT8_HALLR|nr:response regulator [Haloferax larsenii]UVE49999.1 response regulator [Haloferax larsenii]
MTGDELPTVLTVDDEPSLTALYEAWLRDEYSVHTAAGGDDALQVVEAHDVDVVMLDREMPGRSGEAVLEDLRARGYDCPVVMVTGVEPDVDIVEMPFDDYLVKPVGREDLTSTVRDLLTRRSYDEHVREFFALARKKAVLEAACDGSSLSMSDEFAELKAEYRAASRRADAARDDLLTEELGEVVLRH